MEIKINKEKCIGCGTCAVLASKTLKMVDDGKVELIEPPGDDEQTIKNAAAACPVGAIEIT